MYKILALFFCAVVIICAVSYPPKKNVDTLDSAFYDHLSDIQEDTTLAFQDYKAKKVVYVIVHCIASDPTKKRWTAPMLKTFFTTPVKKGGRGWTKYGYNEYIDYSGNLWELTPIDCNEYVDYHELTNNASGYNSISFAISLEGGVEYKNGKIVSKDNFSEIQKQMLKSRLRAFKTKWPWVKIIPHNSVSNKDCPVLDLEEILKDL